MSNVILYLLLAAVVLIIGRYIKYAAIRSGYFARIRKAEMVLAHTDPAIKYFKSIDKKLN